MDGYLWRHAVLVQLLIETTNYEHLWKQEKRESRSRLWWFVGISTSVGWRHPWPKTHWKTAKMEPTFWEKTNQDNTSSFSQVIPEMIVSCYWRKHAHTKKHDSTFSFSFLELYRNLLYTLLAKCQYTLSCNLYDKSRLYQKTVLSLPNVTIIIHYETFLSDKRRFEEP